MAFMLPINTARSLFVHCLPTFPGVLTQGGPQIFALLCAWSPQSVSWGGGRTARRFRSPMTPGHFPPLCRRSLNIWSISHPLPSICQGLLVLRVMRSNHLTDTSGALFSHLHRVHCSPLLRWLRLSGLQLEQGGPFPLSPLISPGQSGAILRHPDRPCLYWSPGARGHQVTVELKNPLASLRKKWGRSRMHRTPIGKEGFWQILAADICQLSS